MKLALITLLFAFAVTGINGNKYEEYPDIYEYDEDADYYEYPADYDEYPADYDEYYAPVKGLRGIRGDGQGWEPTRKVGLRVVSPSDAHNALNNALINMGAVWTGTVIDYGDYKCVMNSWETRDQMARAWNAWNRRFSIPGKIHGRWYCFKK